MRPLDKQNRVQFSDIKTKLCLIVAIVLPALLLLAVAYKFKLAPFGSDFFVTRAQQDTYLPVIAEFHRKVRTGESLFYTWNCGGGMNFWALLGCYGMSPLNLLYLCFPASSIPAVTELIFLLKACLASLALFLMFWKKEDLVSPLTVALSTAYGLSGYMLSYSQEPWMLDAVILLPILILTLSRLVRGRSAWQFSICLALILATSYQAGFYALLFALVMFPLLFMEMRSEGGSVKFKTALKDLLFYLFFGIGGSSICWLPVIRALMRAEVSYQSLMFPRDLTMDLKVWDILERFSFDAAISFPSDAISYPSLYCGILVVFLVILYGFSTKVRFAQKIYCYCTMVFIYVTMSSTVFNFLVHGLHFPITGAYPQAILLTFMAMYMSGRLLSTGVLFEKKTHIQGAVAMIVVFMVINSAINTELSYADYAVFVALILLLLYTAMANKINEIGTKRFSFWAMMICILMVAETGLSFYRPIKEKYYVRAMKNPVLDSKLNQRISGTARKEMLGKEEKMVYELSSEVLYQKPDPAEDALMSDVSERRTISGRFSDYEPEKENFGLIYGVPTLNSNYYITPYLFSEALHDLGMTETKEGTILLSGGTVFTDYLFNHELTRAEGFMSPIAKGAECAHALGFFTSTDEIYSDFRKSDSPFANQNALALQFSGVEPYELLETSVVEKDNISDKGDGAFAVVDAEVSSSITYSFEASYNNTIYIYCDSEQPVIAEIMHCTDAGLESSRERVTSVQSKMLRIDPSPNSGNTIRVRLIMSQPENETVHFSAAVLDEEKLSLCIERMTASPFIVEKESAGELQGHIQAPSSGDLWLSIPYDAGWTVEVDGEKTSVFAANKSFLGIHLTEGEHVITMKYMPQGFTTGQWLSPVSILMMICVYSASFAAKKQAEAKKRKGEDAAVASESQEEEQG
ncbi:MAG: YfhO family protein [Clostridiales bacterium]|nr:YfhO family protein [Clostridiales bacterium]